MKNPLVLIIILLWAFLGYIYWDTDRNCCDENSSAEPVIGQVDEGEEEAAAITDVETPAEKLGPLVFNWDSADPITNEGWQARKSEILSNLGQEKVLEIIGQYRSDEVNNTTFKDLGIARATQVYEQFFVDLPDDRVRLLSKMVDMNEGDKTSPFESCAFEYKINDANIKEVEDKTLIYFPFNSTNKLDNRKVEAYLDDVAERVKASGESVKLTGHTDSIGSAASNITLGQRRADIIKRYLVSKGVPANKITATSMGQTSPIADNGTSQGSAQNRRSELQITK